jgi:RecJ-like exonuclease
MNCVTCSGKGHIELFTSTRVCETCGGTGNAPEPHDVCEAMQETGNLIYGNVIIGGADYGITITNS